MAYKNYTLGRGELHFSPFKTGTETPDGFRYLGNTPEFGLTIESETLQHFNSDRGVKEEDGSVTLQTTRSGSFTADDIQPENLAWFFFGSKGIVAQAADEDLTETFVGVKQGLSYQVGISDSAPTGAKSLLNVVVKVGVATKTLNTDYTLDAELGIVTVVEGGGIADAASMIVEYDVAAKSFLQITSGTEPVVGALRFISYNAAGEKYDYYMPSVKLSANGDLQLKGDEWQATPFNVAILAANGREAIYIDGRPYPPA